MDLDALVRPAPTPDLLSVVRVSDAGAEVLECSGELDLATGPVLSARVQGLLGHRPQRVVIDLCEVSFVDSSGLGSLLAAAREARRAGVDFRLACDVASTLRLLELTGTDAVLAVHRTRRQALESRCAPVSVS